MKLFLSTLFGIELNYVYNHLRWIVAQMHAGIALCIWTRLARTRCLIITLLTFWNGLCVMSASVIMWAAHQTISRPNGVINTAVSSHMMHRSARNVTMLSCGDYTDTSSCDSDVSRSNARDLEGVALINTVNERFMIQSCARLCVF